MAFLLSILKNEKLTTISDSQSPVPFDQCHYLNNIGLTIGGFLRTCGFAYSVSFSYRGVSRAFTKAGDVNHCPNRTGSPDTSAFHHFGKPGEGFQRINAACPRSILREVLERPEGINTRISCFSWKMNRVLLKERRYYMRIKPIDSVGEK